MRYMRTTALSVSTILLAVTLFLSGCGNNPNPGSTPSTDSTVSTGAGDTGTSEETTTADSGTQTGTDTQSSGSTTTGKGGSTTKTTKPTGTTKATSTTKLSNIPSSAKDKWGDQAGLTSTKKTPDWMKQIPNGKIVTLTSSKKSADDLAYEKTLFKSLTGKELELQEKVVEWNSLRGTLNTMVMAGSGPDVFGIYNGVAVYLRNKGLARNIKDFINMNDAAWDGMKSTSEVMFFKGELTGVTLSNPTITGGVMYNKTLIKQAGLEDPWSLYESKQWNITKFLEYVEELTEDKDHNGIPEVYGVSMSPESLFRMAVSSGEDLVKINADGSFSNNLRSATFTRWASYAKKITAVGSYDTESWTAGQRFTQNKIAMMGGQNVWEQFSSKALIDMKKAGKLGWVPSPMDINAKTYYHNAEQTYYFLPKNSANAKGGAAYLYTLRYAQLNPSSARETAEKNKYMNEYGWTAAEYDFQKNMSKSFTPVTFNWIHIPGFDYTSLWNVFKDDWSKLVEKVYPSLQSALNAQNQ